MNSAASHSRHIEDRGEKHRASALRAAMPRVGRWQRTARSKPVALAHGRVERGFTSGVLMASRSTCSGRIGYGTKPTRTIRCSPASTFITSTTTKRMTTSPICKSYRQQNTPNCTLGKSSTTSGRAECAPTTRLIRTHTARAAQKSARFVGRNSIDRLPHRKSHARTTVPVCGQRESARRSSSFIGAGATVPASRSRDL